MLAITVLWVPEPQIYLKDAGFRWLMYSEHHSLRTIRIKETRKPFISIASYNFVDPGNDNREPFDILTLVFSSRDTVKKDREEYNPVA